MAFRALRLGPEDSLTNMQLCPITLYPKWGSYCDSLLQVPERKAKKAATVALVLADRAVEAEGVYCKCSTPFDPSVSLVPELLSNYSMCLAYDS